VEASRTACCNGEVDVVELLIDLWHRTVNPCCRIPGAAITCCFLTNRLGFLGEILHVYVIILYLRLVPSGI